jgi:hypothetical protein
MPDDEILALMCAHHRLWIAFTTEQVSCAQRQAVFEQAHTALYAQACAFPLPAPGGAQ